MPIAETKLDISFGSSVPVGGSITGAVTKLKISSWHSVVIPVIFFPDVSILHLGADGVDGGGVEPLPSGALPAASFASISASISFMLNIFDLRSLLPPPTISGNNFEFVIDHPRTLMFEFLPHFPSSDSSPAFPFPIIDQGSHAFMYNVSSGVVSVVNKTSGICLLDEVPKFCTFIPYSLQKFIGIVRSFLSLRVDFFGYSLTSVGSIPKASANISG